LRTEVIVRSQALAAWLFIVAAFVFLAVGAFGTPRHPVFTILGIAFFIVGFTGRRRGRRRAAGNERPRV
jgi:membrane-bound ClpP family serine protease